MFEPEPLKLPKKGKRIFKLFLTIIWVALIGVAVWSVKPKSSNSKNLPTRDNLLNVQSSDGKSPNSNQDLKFDEILGPSKINDQTGNDQQTSNPSGNSGSIEKLLEGKEIVIPNK